MDKFCKLFETDDKGQLLVILDTSDDDGSPQIAICCQPENLGVCKVKLGYEDSDEGWDKAEAAFDKFDESMARKATEQAFLLSDAQEAPRPRTARLETAPWRNSNCTKHPAALAAPSRCES